MLTFSTQDILINWSFYSSPAGLEGYKQRGGDWSASHIFTSLKMLRDCSVKHSVWRRRGTTVAVVRGEWETVEPPHLEPLVLSQAQPFCWPVRSKHQHLP